MPTDETFWEGLGGAANIGQAWRIVLYGLGYRGVDTNDTNPVHPMGQVEYDASEAFAVDYNEVARKNPQLGWAEIIVNPLDLSDARYNAMQNAVEIQDAENATWEQIVTVARGRPEPDTTVRQGAAVGPGVEGGGFTGPQPDPGDGPPDEDTPPDGAAEASGGSTAFLIGGLAAAAFLVLALRK